MRYDMLSACSVTIPQPWTHLGNRVTATCVGVSFEIWIVQHMRGEICRAYRKYALTDVYCRVHTSVKRLKKDPHFAPRCYCI